MKKLLSLFLAAILVSLLLIPAQAAETGIKMTNVTVQEGKTVYVPVSLTSATTATAIGLSYTYDSTLLKVIPGECTWKQTGALSNFSQTSNQAVWASDGAKQLSGELCVLAFRVLDAAAFTEATVTCTVTIENGSTITGPYEASAKLTKASDDFLLGDVTGDGKVTAADYSRLLAHVKKTNVITDEATLQAADVTGDGKITAADYSRLLAHVKKLSPLW